MTVRAGALLTGLTFSSGPSIRPDRPTKGAFLRPLVFTTMVGEGTISGVATVHGDAGAILLLLQEPTGEPLASTVAATDGAYAFTRVPAGHYAIVVIDSAGVYRGKVIHTVVPP